MEKSEVILRLRIGLIKRKVGFTYEWKAWLMAWDMTGGNPEDFGKQPLDLQMSSLAYGAASWYQMKRGKPMRYTFGQVTEALLRASKADNIRLAKAMEYAQFPEWIKQGEDGKKKA